MNALCSRYSYITRVTTETPQIFLHLDWINLSWHLLILLLFRWKYIFSVSVSKKNVSTDFSCLWTHHGVPLILSSLKGFLFVCLKVYCYDYHVNGSHSLIGSFQTTLAEMQIATPICPVRLFRVYHSCSTKGLLLLIWMAQVTLRFLLAGWIWVHQPQKEGEEEEKL